MINTNRLETVQLLHQIKGLVTAMAQNSRLCLDKLSACGQLSLIQLMSVKICVQTLSLLMSTKPNQRPLTGGRHSAQSNSGQCFRYMKSFRRPRTIFVLIIWRNYFGIHASCACDSFLSMLGDFIKLK